MSISKPNSAQGKANTFIRKYSWLYDWVCTSLDTAGWPNCLDRNCLMIGHCIVRPLSVYTRCRRPMSQAEELSSELSPELVTKIDPAWADPQLGLRLPSPGSWSRHLDICHTPASGHNTAENWTQTREKRFNQLLITLASLTWPSCHRCSIHHQTEEWQYTIRKLFVLFDNIDSTCKIPNYLEPPRMDWFEIQSV